VKIIPGATGIQELADLNFEQIEEFFDVKNNNMESKK